MHCSRDVTALKVESWGALFPRDDTSLGCVKPVDAIPESMRRRMPIFMRAAIRCALGVMNSDTSLIFSSRHGDLSTAGAMLQELAGEGLLSPIAFSASVHNAAAGIAHQILGFRASHTAIAAGSDCLTAGLFESYARLLTGEHHVVALVCGDMPLPNIYEDFEDDRGEDVFIALQLTLDDSPCSASPVSKGPQSAAMLIKTLAQGIRSICISDTAWA